VTLTGPTRPEPRSWRRRIVDDGFKGQVDLSLRGGADVRERLRDDAKAASFLVNIEVFEQCFAVTIDVKHPAVDAAAAEIYRTGL
jgi:hypothetical protein